VTEPLPAGAAVIEDSVSGPFERFEISPGAITFYLGNKPEHARITYEVHGYVAGQYRATPTLVRDAFRPDQIAVAEPRPLAVLAAGAASGDAYRLTPQELYELGRRHFEKGDLAVAAKHLNDLFNQWNLKPEFYKENQFVALAGYSGPSWWREPGPISKNWVKKDGTPVFVRDIATVSVGHAVRQGAAQKDGARETVGGIVMMLRGENSRDVVKHVDAKVSEINANHVLPDGLRIVPFYERLGGIPGTAVLWRNRGTAGT
jgi:hypothetical protein